jgi:septal ring factor EnvC (AmiA/AmiB activator)
LKNDTKNEVDELTHKLELLKRMQERDVRKQYIHEHYTQTDSNEYLQQLRETVKKREQEIKAIEQQIEEIINS